MRRDVNKENECLKEGEIEVGVVVWTGEVVCRYPVLFVSTGR